MSRKGEHPASALRRQAEERIASSGGQPDGDSPSADTSTLIHDLRVHQIELELQNEELRETQKHLEAARDSYSRLFHQAPVGYLIVQDNGIVSQVNATFCSMVDAQARGMVGKPLSDFLEQEDRGIFLGRFKAFFNNPEGKTMEVRMRRGKEAFPVRIRGRVEDKIPMTPDGRKPVRGLLLILSDISEQKQAEAVLLTAKETAEAASRAKTDFLVNMSHELRTPLNGLLGMLGLLNRPDLEGEQAKLLAMAVSSANRLTGVLTDILDLTEIESGRFKLNRRSFPVRQLAESVHDMFAPVFLDKGVSLQIETAADLPMIANGDEVRIRQVLFNLVGNGVKFTPSGEVRVSLHWEPSDRAECFLLLLRVTDTGIGMSPEQRSFAFDSFYQADLSLTKRYQGAGLGLTIVRQLVDLMQGTLSLRSATGQGTEVTCLIPLEYGIL